MFVKKNWILRFVEGAEDGAPPSTEGAEGGEKKEEAKPQEETPDQTIARLNRELASARGEAAKGRVTAKEKAANEREADVVNKILGALGLNKEGEKVQSADELMSTLQQVKHENQQLRLRDAVRAAAAGVDGASADRLLRDSVFLDDIKDFDPSNTTTLKSKITATLETAPWLRVEQAQEAPPRKSGTDMSGGTGEGALTPDKFRQMSGAERNSLFRTNRAEYDRLTQGA